MIHATDKEQKSSVMDLLLRKENYLKEFLRITKVTVFKGDDDYDAENYVSMIEKRENIVKELKSIDQNLNLPMYKDVLEDEEFSIKVNIQKEAIKDVIKKIIRFEMNLEDVKENIMKNLKSKLKEINTSKNINKAMSYQGEYAINDGMYFDSKNL